MFEVEQKGQCQYNESMNIMIDTVKTSDLWTYQYWSTSQITYKLQHI